MMGASFDAQARIAVGEIPIPELEGQPFVLPKPLNECTVAIVTSAGLHAPGERVEIRGATAIELRGELITRSSSYYDLASALRQLGVLPPLPEPE